MFVIANNCCGGRLYQETNTQFNNPFIWMVLPYDSVMYIMKNFNKINWYNYEFEKSKLRANTFIIKIENNIEIHYVHYIFSEKDSIIRQEKNHSDKEEQWSGEVFYNKIWEYINEKYLNRTERMLKTNENPCFLIKDEPYANKNSKYDIKDITYCDCPFKRIIITQNKSINRNDEICKTIHISKIEDPLPTIKHNINTIKEFFNL